MPSARAFPFASLWLWVALICLPFTCVNMARADKKSCAWPEECGESFTAFSFSASGCQPSAMTSDDGFMGLAAGCPELYTNAQPAHTSRAGTLKNFRCDVLDDGTWIAGDGYVFTLWEDANNITIGPGEFATILTCATSTTGGGTANRQCSDLVSERNIAAGAFFAIRIASNNATTPAGGTEFFCTVELHY